MSTVRDESHEYEDREKVSLSFPIGVLRRGHVRPSRLPTVRILLVIGEPCGLVLAWSAWSAGPEHHNAQASFPGCFLPSGNSACLRDKLGPWVNTYVPHLG